MSYVRGFYAADIDARAAMLGISCRELVRIGQDVDRRIIAAPSLDTPGAIARTRRWLAAGSPAADLARLEFAGDDSVRELVLDVLRRLPAPVAWHAVEFVAWLEVGRSAAGWQGLPPKTRTPDGDQPHAVALCGQATDDFLRGVIAHELGHSWSRPIQPTRMATVRMSHRECTARRAVAAQFAGLAPAAFVRERVADEKLADSLATLWGYPRHTDEQGLSRLFAGEQADAAELAAQVARDIEKGTP